MSKTTAHPLSRVMSASEANEILNRFGFGSNAIGEALSDGPDGRRGRVDMLRHRWIGRSSEACGARREIRVSADWADGEESHEATATLAYRWDGCRKWEPVK